MLDLESLVETESPKIAEEVLEVARSAETEEDLREGVSTALAFFARKAGIQLQARHEYSIGTGRADSVYSLVVIEYKVPGSMTKDNQSAVNKKVIDQVKDRIVGFQKEEHRSREKMFGVGTDGFCFVFVRFRGGEWDVSEPEETSSLTIETFLRKLSSIGVQGKAITVDNLIADFGENSNVAAHSIPRLMNAVTNMQSARAKKFYQQWKELFGAVCGYDLTTKKEHVQSLAGRYKLPKNTKPDDLLFSIHSYYAIFMKLLMSEVVSYTKGTDEFVSHVVNLTGPRFKERLEEFESTGLVNQIGIKNFMEGDLFSWYISEWNDEIEHVLHEMMRGISEYEPSTLGIEPDETRDLLKGLYQFLIDRPVRHDLGEFYTPDWLADRVIDAIGYDGNASRRVLDPACGSGTFLVMTINRIRKISRKERADSSKVLAKILENVVGFDLNPLAVMAARTNYVIALGNLLRHQKSDIEIPVYLCDSVVIPKGTSDPYGGGAMKLATEVGVFEIPLFMVEKQKISILADCIESAVQDDYSWDSFERFLRRRLEMSDSDFENGQMYLKATYEKILELERTHVNGIWSRIIKNGFAPIFKGRFDYVIGNPPWINWENLPEGYRKRSVELWKEYGLFSLRGYEARLGGGRKDVSALFVYASVDRYLEPHGKLAFLVTQTLLKSGGAGAGFRRFMLDRERQFRMLEVHDYVEIQPFEDANNMTALIVLRRSSPTKYPVPYWKWKKEGRIRSEMSSEEARGRMRRLELVAVPVDKRNPTSQWFTVKEELVVLRDILGKSKYEAYEGANSGGANGIYWVRVKAKKFDGSLLVENMNEVSHDKSLKHVERRIEPDLLFPMMKSRNCKRWNVEGDLTYSIVSQDPVKRIGVKEDLMKDKYPLTYKYLKEFEEELGKRASKAVRSLMENGPFYSMFGISTETFAKHKVVWSSMGSNVNACVVGHAKDDVLGSKPIIPEHVLNFVVCRNIDEAFYLCAILNSELVNYILQSYSVTGGKNFAPTKILDLLNIPRFDKEEQSHVAISDLGKKLARAPDDAELEDELNSCVGRLYGLEKGVSKLIAGAYEELNA